METVVLKRDILAFVSLSLSQKKDNKRDWKDGLEAAFKHLV